MTERGIRKDVFMGLPFRDGTVGEVVGQRFRFDDNEPDVGDFVRIIEVVEIVKDAKEQDFSSPIEIDSTMPETSVRMELKFYQVI